MVAQQAGDELMTRRLTSKISGNISSVPKEPRTGSLLVGHVAGNNATVLLNDLIYSLAGEPPISKKHGGATVPYVMLGPGRANGFTSTWPLGEPNTLATPPTSAAANGPSSRRSRLQPRRLGLIRNMPLDAAGCWSLKEMASKSTRKPCSS
jgi:hypothetical protein